MTLEPIIQYYIDKGELNERAAFDLRSFIEDLEGQTEYTTTRLKEILQRFNHDTIDVERDKGHYGKVAIKEKDSIRICDYSFEKFARYAQDQPMQPEIFSAQTNDIAFLRKRIAEGWDFNTNYHYLDALGQAAEYNAHEALELLLQNGARPHNRYHREKPWEYDEKTMDLLDQYP